MSFGWDKAFIGQGSKALERLGLAKQIYIISPEPRELDLPISYTEKLTLRQACQRKIAICEGDDSFLVRGTVFVASLTAASYFRAGIEAERRGDRYIGVYDLNKSGKKLMRLLWAFDNTLKDRYVFKVCAPPEKIEWTLAELYKPTLHLPRSNLEEFQDEVHEALEWIGLCIQDAPILHPETELDPSICSLPRLGSVERVARVAATGLFEPSALRAAWRSFGSMPWAVMHVKGFFDGPIAWGKPHAGGDYSVTLILSHGLETEIKVISSGDLSNRRIALS